MVGCDICIDQRNMQLVINGNRNKCYRTYAGICAQLETSDDSDDKVNLRKMIEMKGYFCQEVFKPLDALTQVSATKRRGQQGTTKQNPELQHVTMNDSVVLEC